MTLPVEPRPDWRQLTPARRRIVVNGLRAEGLTMVRIAARFENCNAKAIENIFKRDRAKAKAKAEPLMPIRNDPKPADDVLAARFAEIPSDTRNLTAFICGDPLPGRSALDRRNVGAR